MADTTSKKMGPKDFEQGLRTAYNDINGTTSVDGFLTGVVGRQITQTITTTNTTDDTAVFRFYEDFGSTLLYEYTIVYTDGTQQTLLSATRTA